MFDDGVEHASFDTVYGLRTTSAERGLAMSDFAPSSGLAGAARLTLTAAAAIFMYTIVIGILNGMDVWEPEHDVLMSHVHSGTLGWITLGVAGIAFLMFSEGRQVHAGEQRQVAAMARALIGAVVMYVLAFLAAVRSSTTASSDRSSEPLAGRRDLVARLVHRGLPGLRVPQRRPPRVPALVDLAPDRGPSSGCILGLYTSNGKSSPASTTRRPRRSPRRIRRRW